MRNDSCRMCSMTYKNKKQSDAINIPQDLRHCFVQTKAGLSRPASHFVREIRNTVQEKYVGQLKKKPVASGHLHGRGKYKTGASALSLSVAFLYKLV